jgi:hypothetical protein
MNIVTGDDIEIAVTLKVGGLPFVINSTATVKAAILDKDRKNLLVPAVTLSSADLGSNWDTSIVVVKIPGTATVALKTAPVKLDIQVNDNGKKTWTADINLIKGLIS